MLRKAAWKDVLLPRIILPLQATNGKISFWFLFRKPVLTPPDQVDKKSKQWSYFHSCFIFNLNIFVTLGVYRLATKSLISKMGKLIQGSGFCLSSFPVTWDFAPLTHSHHLPKPIPFPSSWFPFSHFRMYKPLSLKAKPLIWSLL